MIFKGRKVIFIGNLIFSKELLNTVFLNKKFKVIGIISKNKSLFNSDQFSLKNTAKFKKIKYFNYTKKNKKKMKTFIKKLKPDYIFCFGWSHILNSDIIQIPSKKCIGYHPTLLPMNKGRHPIIWAIVLGLKETGSSFFEIMNKIDSGKILSQKKVKISIRETSTSLYKKLILVAKKQLKNLLKKIESNTYPKKISNKKIYSNYWRKRNFEDGVIDFRQSSKSIIRLVNALKYPYQNASIKIKNKFIKVQDCKLIKHNSRNYVNLEPGRIIKTNNHMNLIDVKCNDALLRIKLEKIKKEIFKESIYL